MGLRSHKADWRRTALAALLVPTLVACLVAGLSRPAFADPAKSEAPVPAATAALMAAKDIAPAAPILIRSYKVEGELEVWKRARNGRYVHLKTFPICRWSGQLGPKLRNGDRQTPEGFYPVAKKQMNPNSAYYLSFDIGFPNAYDRAHGASGSFLMVHGTCSSAGCYAMTDRQVGEIYALARDAFAGGQAAFQFQAYPFRMTAQNMARHRSDPHIAFWRQLKEGSDRFEATGEEPSVGVADGRYAFAPYKDPAKEAAAKARLADEEARVAKLVEGGIAGVRTTYADGGGHTSFRYAQLNAPTTLGMVSRPEALAFAGKEIIVIPAKKKPACPGPACPTQVASATPTVPSPPVEPLRMPPPAPGFLLAHPHPISGPEPSLFARTALAATPVAQPTPAPGSTRIVPATWTSLRF